MSFLRQVLTILRKELLIELRQRSRLTGVFFFAFALLLMVAFAMPNTEMLSDMAGGALWLGLLLASTRSLDQSFTTETENNTLEGLVLWPTSPIALYYGKALANALVLLLVCLALTPLVIVLYHPQTDGSWLWLFGIQVFGCCALAAPGTLVSALTTRARGSSALLPLLLFPLVVPVIMAASRATSVLFEGDPMGQVDNWLGVLAGFNALHWTIDGLLFSRIVDEG